MARSPAAEVLAEPPRARAGSPDTVTLVEPPPPGAERARQKKALAAAPVSQAPPVRVAHPPPAERLAAANQAKVERRRPLG